MPSLLTLCPMQINQIRMMQAELSAKRSKCISLKVGSIIVVDDRIVSEGFNGTPKGYINCCDNFTEYNSDHHDWSSTYEIHAEMNAIIYSAKKGISIDGGVIYSTTKPCLQCTKNIIASGIKKIYYKDDYSKNNDIELNEFLKACNIEIERVVYE